MGRLLFTEAKGEKKQDPPSPRVASSLTPPFSMYNSLTRTMVKNLLEEGSRNSKGLAIYTCGPTTYAPAHLGHARTYVWLDVFRRALEHHHCHTSTLPGPLFAMNVTDVDDKILAAAAEESGCDNALPLARRCEAAFWDDWDRLHCLRPHVVTRVSDYVESHIVPYVRRLADSGLAYVADHDGDGSVYFDVRAYEDRLQGRTRYGKLAPPAASRDWYDRVPGGDDEGSPQRPAKRDPRDFCLWKRRKPDEGLWWDSPWGEGRPGWHIECSAMIEAVQELFHDSHIFAVHCGGVDLQFPHHTNEIAQAEAYHLASSSQPPQFRHGHAEWIPHWIHTGHLYINGLKMSKSLKNFVTIEEMLQDGADDPASRSPGWSPADDFRLWCLGLSGPYRESATYSPDRLRQARQMRLQLVRFLWDAEEFAAQARRREVTDSSSAKAPLTQKLSVRDADFYQAVQAASLACHAALRSDLDGASYVRELVKLAGAGRTYLAAATTGDSTHPPPLVSLVCHAAETLRGLLALVGFSPVTSQAGAVAGASSSGHPHSTVVGGERALLDELVLFRAAVRRAAVAGLRVRVGDTEAGAALQDILAACDDARDRALPSLGVELLDAKSGGPEEEEEEGESHAVSASPQWRYCLPRSASDASAAHPSQSRPSSPSLSSALVPPVDYFKGGAYEGQFEEWDESGIPIRHAGGAPVSNRLRQKLQKKLDKHVRRCRAEEWDPPSPPPADGA